MTQTKPQFLNSLKRASCGACGKPKLALLGSSPFLVLLVKDSEYSRSAGTKPILSLSCIYLVSLARCCCCCCGSCGFLLLLLRAPTLPRPLYFGGGKYQKEKSPVASGVAFGHGCVGVGVVEVAVQCKHNTSEV